MNFKHEIENTSPYRVPLLENNNGNVNLSLNENLFGCSPKCLSTLNALSIDDISFYQNDKHLQTAIAKNINLNNENITISDRKSTRLNSSHIPLSRMPSSA